MGYDVGRDVFKATSLVGYSHSKGHSFARVVSQKGQHHVIAQAVLQWFQELGIGGQVRIRTDPEPAIVSFVESLARRRPEAFTLLETTTAGSSSSIGGAEIMIGFWQGNFVYFDWRQKSAGKFLWTCSMDRFLGLCNMQAGYTRDITCNDMRIVREHFMKHCIL